MGHRAPSLPISAPYEKLSLLERAHSDEAMAMRLTHMAEQELRNAATFAEKLQQRIADFAEQAKRNRELAQAESDGQL